MKRLFCFVLAFFASTCIPTRALKADGGTVNLDEELAKWQPVKMPFNASGLTKPEQQMVQLLVQACQYVNLIYWEQSDPKGLELYKTTTDPKIKRMLAINGSRFDLLDGNKPFTGSDPFLPGRNIFPPGLTRQQIEDIAAKDPDLKLSLYNPLTILRWNNSTGIPKLETIDYDKAYANDINQASALLIKAADLTPDLGLAHYLRLRAEGMLTDNYYPSDVAWVDLVNPKIDLILAPYETYLDDVLGVKASWGAAVLIRNETESEKLALYAKYIPQIQQALPLDAADKPSKEGQPTPMEVMDSPFRAGDLRYGYQAVADNLPNDPRIHAEKGTKKIFFKNFMDARVNSVILPLAKQVMRADQASQATGEGYLAAVVLHEICHGLGPAYSRVNGARKDIREAIGPAYPGLEEAKADVVGMFGLGWLVDHDALPKRRLQEYYASYVAGIFRTVRYGVAEAHGQAEMMEFNYYAERQAIVEQNGRWAIDYAKMPAAIAALAKELLEIEATGDRSRAEQWFAKYRTMPANLTQSLARVHGVPVDVDPTFDWPDLPANAQTSE
jgi:hypothetical protein